MSRKENFKVQDNISKVVPNDRDQDFVKLAGGGKETEGHNMQVLNVSSNTNGEITKAVRGHNTKARCESETCKRTQQDTAGVRVTSKETTVAEPRLSSMRLSQSKMI